MIRRITLPLRHPNVPHTTIATLVCLLAFNSVSHAAELFPFTPPATQQRPSEQQPLSRPQLTPDDLERISQIAVQAKQLSAEDRNHLKASIQKSLTEAAAKGNASQAQYYGELLRRID